MDAWAYESVRKILIFSTIGIYFYVIYIYRVLERSVREDELESVVTWPIVASAVPFVMIAYPFYRIYKTFKEKV